MRILVGADVAPDPDSGAAGTVCASNAALRGLGHAVDEFWAADLRHRIRHWNLHYLLELPREYREAVRRRVRNGTYDVIQLSQPHAWLAARDHRRRRGGVFINRSHGLESLADAALGEWHRRLEVRENRFPRSLLTPLLRRRLHRHIDLVARHADGILVPASDIKQHLIERHGAAPERIAVIAHGVPDDYLDAARPPLTAARLLRLLHVGQYSFIKGPALVARAAAAIFEAEPAARLTWVCSAEHHVAVRALFDARHRERVELAEWVPRDQLRALYDAHGILLAHSIYEGAAKACTEAMARGLVVVSSRVGALKDLVVHGEHGYLVEVGDTEAMACCALEAQADVARAAAVGRRAAERAAELRWRDHARAAIRFYQDLLDRRAA
jgi:glycosyltransferase involved in cell wall biosynthesis